MSALRRLAPRLVAAFLGIGLALGVAEFWLRQQHGSALPERLPLLQVAAHATRGYAMLPGQAHYTYQHPVAVNSLGLRGPELPPASPDQRRVLLLGDSMVYGQGVADGDTLPAALERELCRKQPSQVVNGGVRAYATHQELALLAELGPAIAPDVVVLCWYWNDLEERDVAATYKRLDKSGPIAFDLAEPPRGLPLLGWHIKQILRKSTLVMLLWDAWMQGERVPPEPKEVEAAFKRLEAYLAEFKRLCAELGAEPRFVTIPDAISSVGSLTRQLEVRALKLAAAAGIPTLDPRSSLEHLPEPTTLPFDGHYNAAGNRALAYRLAEWFDPPEPLGTPR